MFTSGEISFLMENVFNSEIIYLDLLTLIDWLIRIQIEIPKPK